MSVSNITENEWTDFHEISAKVGYETRNTLEYFRDVVFNPLNPLNRFFYFMDSWLLVISWKKGEGVFMKFLWNIKDDTRNSQIVSRLIRLFQGLPSSQNGVSVSNITAKWMNGFSWIIRICRLGHKEQPGTFWGVMRLNPWIQDSVLYFLDPCLLATLRNKGWMDIHEILRIWLKGTIGWTVSRLNKLIQAPQTWHGRGLRSQSASCLISRNCSQIVYFIVQPYRICQTINAVNEKPTEWSDG